MKYYFVLAFCLASAMGAMAKFCDSGDNCAKDECCVNYFVFSKCETLKRINEPCLVLDLEKKPPKYDVLCPCADELKCVNQRVLDIYGHKVPYDSRCVVPSEATPQLSTS